MYRSPTRLFPSWRSIALLAAPGLWILSTIALQPVSAQGGAGAATWRWGSLRPTDSWNTFVAEMTVRRRHVTADGTVVGVPSPAATYRLERSMMSGSWRTVLTVLSMEQARLYSLEGLLGSPAPLTVKRIEDDEDGTPVRAFDSLGRRLRLPDLPASGVATAVAGGAGTTPGAAGSVPGAAAGAGAGGASPTTYHPASTSWIDGFVATAAQAPARQLALEREFGRPTTVQGMSRFVKSVGASSEEVLVLPPNVIPIEANVSENSLLMAHRTFTYQPAFDGAMVRSAVHSEQRVSASNSERLITDTSFANVGLERR